MQPSGQPPSCAKRLRWWPLVTAVFAVALTVRLAVAAVSPLWMHDDGVGYDQVAQSIVRGEGFSRNGRPTAVEDPLYPGFLALVYRVFGHHPWAVRAVQSVLNAAACSLVAVLGVFAGGPAAGWLSGLSAACYPSLVKVSCHWLSEALFIPLLVGALTAWTQWQRVMRARWALVSGLLFGLASLTRFGVAALPYVLAWLAWRRARSMDGPIRSGMRRQALLMLLAMAVTILPWTIRNWLVFHEVIPISTKIGLDVYASYFPPDGKRFGLTPVDANMALARSMTSETKASVLLIRETWRLVTQHPVEVLRQLVLKIGFFVTPFDWEILGYRVYNIGYSLVIPWALAGLYVARRRRLLVGPLLTMLAYYGVLTVVTYGSPRLRLPLEPAFLVFAAITWLAFAERARPMAVRLPVLATWSAGNLFLWWHASGLHGLIKRLASSVGLW